MDQCRRPTPLRAFGKGDPITTKVTKVKAFPNSVVSAERFIGEVDMDLFDFPKDHDLIISIHFTSCFAEHASICKRWKGAAVLRLA